MAYIGKQPTIGNFVKLDTITTSATDTFNLTNGAVAYSPQSPNHCIVSLNGVIQSPTTSFTISGSTIVFASALTASDVIDFILVLGDVLNIGTPSDATVGFSKVTSNLITGATSETTIDGADSVLIYDDSATALRKMTRTNFVSGLNNTPAFEAHRGTSNQSITNLTATKVQFNTELFDTDSAYDNATNYRFTPQVAGKYFVYSGLFITASTVTMNISQFVIEIRKNGSTLRELQMYNNTTAVHLSNYIYGSVTMNGTTDYVEVFMLTRSATGNASTVNFAAQGCFFGAYRLIGV